MKFVDGRPNFGRRGNRKLSDRVGGGTHSCQEETDRDRCRQHEKAEGGGVPDAGIDPPQHRPNDRGTHAQQGAEPEEVEHRPTDGQPEA
ncbi:MAG: hypothetical protein ACM3U2_01900 [Deltaproteobacteria bacterium]